MRRWRLSAKKNLYCHRNSRKVQPRHRFDSGLWPGCSQHRGQAEVDKEEIMEFDNMPMSAGQQFSMQIEADNWSKLYGNLIVLAMYGQTTELDRRLKDYNNLRLMDLRRALTVLQPIIEIYYKNEPGDFN